MKLDKIHSIQNIAHVSPINKEINDYNSFFDEK